ncbi:hypothetical protein [Mucilaginibacter paludis]|uniref:Uncharacterized protein n=1 Tax=Mucilaginibacter paludis DSM 18603 TaxID=714943 RepID=H1YHY9_9SPHI|nr:hypothetical protein [Mucilaginibacter paludis]EHQ25537.1 hypothetical protein Mucpa_1377 [Mucilaginibacter paludis DSM 18603]
MLVSAIPGMIQKLFPMSAGIIFTGSQVNNVELNNLSDVDIIVFNFQFSVVSTVNAVISGISLDITLVPLYDIENVLLNESLHYRGILLSMIVNGRIIRDLDNKIVRSIQIAAKSFHKSGHVARTNIYNDRVKDLGRLAKEFRKELDFKQKFLLINDFIYHMSQIEIAKGSDWIISEKQKNRYLSSANGPFIEDMISIAKEHLFNEQVENLSKIADYITSYVENAKLFERSTGLLNRYVIDINFHNFTIETFYNVVVRALKNEEYFKERYKYSFTSPTQFHRIFSNRVSLTFQINSANDAILLNQDLKKLFNNLLRKKVQINTRATYIYTDSNPNSAFRTRFEDVAMEVERMIHGQVSESNCYSVERNLHISTIIFAHIFKFLNCAMDDVEKSLTYLIHRYFFMQSEQRKIKSMKEFMDYKNKKLQLHHLYYFKNKHDFADMVKKGFYYEANKSNSERKEYSGIIDELSVFLSEQSKSHESLISNNQLTYNILHNYCGITEADKALLFILSFEQLAQLLHFDFTHKGLSLYILVNSINELRNQKHDD